VLARLRGQKDVKGYGVAFWGQQLSEKPVVVHVKPIDGIFSDQGVIYVRSTV
jgi:hypothetical protein